MPGVARQQATFFCFAKRKYPKKRRPQVRRPSGSLRCSQTRAAAELVLVEALAHTIKFVLALKQSSRTAPAFVPLLGDSHGALCRNAMTANQGFVVPAKAGTQVPNVKKLARI